MNVILDTPRFMFADLSRVTGVAQTNLKGWLNRGAVSFGGFDREAGGSGGRRLLTLRTVYQFAITAKIVGLGVPPAVAFAAAAAFTRREESENRKEDTRNPDTLLYSEGKTLFIVLRGNIQSREYSPLEPFNSGVDIYQLGDKPTDNALFDILFNSDDVVAVVHCNPILEGVDKALDVRRE